ncbi:MAG: NAD(P)H-dependent glycerol-3-phosphate dehydrogenase [Clostridia bacterium]|nr:NAD(P)H-dependent glycerol-3-phosphate dehydrogenase [Clostridia bacterium]
MKITVLGTGALGIAITKVLFENGQKNICMWTKFKEEKELIEKERENSKLLKGVKIAEEIKITNDIEEAIKGSKMIINCLPFVAISSTAQLLKPYYKDQLICSTTKGIDMETFKTTTETFEKILDTDKVCALSGPSFAIEIANNETIYFILAGKNNKALEAIYNIIKNDNFIIEISNDPVGVQVCGAVKNAVAIGSGILHGMKSADSTKAAYLARGINDIMKVIKSLGGKEETMHTYAGIGDLILTCMSEKSRNFSCGKLIGEGYTLNESIEKLNGKTVEGIKVIESLNKYIKDKNITLDTVPKLYNIIFNEGKLDTIKTI